MQLFHRPRCKLIHQDGCTSPLNAGYIGTMLLVMSESGESSLTLRPFGTKKKKKRLILCCSIALFVSYNQRTKCGTSVSFDLTTHSKNMSSSIQMRSCDRALTGGIEQALRVVIGAHLASGRGYADVGANTCLPRWVLGFCCGLKQKSRIHRAIRKWSVNVVCHINVVEIWCANKI